MFFCIMAVCLERALKNMLIATVFAICDLKRKSKLMMTNSDIVTAMDIVFICRDFFNRYFLLSCKHTG